MWQYAASVTDTMTQLEFVWMESCVNIQEQCEKQKCEMWKITQVVFTGVYKSLLQPPHMQTDA